jgi:amidohydrolase
MTDLAQLLAQVETLDWQEDLYRHLHAHPELSGEEHATSALMAEHLRRIGVDEVVENIGGTGLVGILRNGPGPTILMRADMDALPVTEESGLPYASTVRAIDREGNDVGVMHACGHDFHMVWLLGATEVLANNRDAWSGTYLALFQPAEEHGSGARDMVNDGLTKRVPAPDICLGQHVGSERAGSIHARSGPAMAQSDSIDIVVHGRGGHGSSPHSAIDPVVLVAAIITRLQTIVARELSPWDFGVVTVGMVEAGSKSNIIPATGRLQVNVRSYEPEVRERILTAIERIVKAECDAAGCERQPDIRYFDQVPLTANDPDVTEKVMAAFREVYGDEVMEAEPDTGSEDFSEIPNAWGVPYSYWFVGGWDAEEYDKAEAAGRIDSDIPTNHSPFFAPVLQPTLRVGTEAALIAAMVYLSQD